MLQLCSFSVLFWLFRALCNSTWIWRSIFPCWTEINCWAPCCFHGGPRTQDRQPLRCGAQEERGKAQWGCWTKVKDAKIREEESQGLKELTAQGAGVRPLPSELPTQCAHPQAPPVETPKAETRMPGGGHPAGLLQPQTVLSHLCPSVWYKCIPYVDPCRGCSRPLWDWIKCPSSVSPWLEILFCGFACVRAAGASAPHMPRAYTFIGSRYHSHQTFAMGQALFKTQLSTSIDVGCRHYD